MESLLVESVVTCWDNLHLLAPKATLSVASSGPPTCTCSFDQKVLSFKNSLLDIILV